MSAKPFVPAPIVLEAVDSTNDEAKRRIAAGWDEPLPACLRALEQTRGRGRGDHAWWSDRGSLTFTLVLDPVAAGIRPEREPLIALACAVAALRAVAALAPGASGLGLRWPNDLEADQGKLGGLLTERVEGPTGPRVLVGIGVNVTTNLDAAPAAVAAMATSVGRLAGQALGEEAIESFLRDLLDRIGTMLGRLAQGDPTLADEWIGRDRLRGRPVRVRQGNRLIEGVGRGIDRDGALLLDTPEGLTRIVGGQVLR